MLIETTRIGVMVIGGCTFRRARSAHTPVVPSRMWTSAPVRQENCDGSGDCGPYHHAVRLDRSYFELQAKFAARIAEIEGLDLGEAYRLHTAFYALARDNDAGVPPERNDFDPTHPAWVAFLEALDSGADAVDYVYQAYIDGDAREEDQATTCFAFDYWPDDRLVRIHFSNDQRGNALRPASVADRRRELTSIFQTIALEHPDAQVVRGTSWLYHLHAYRRHFPPSFIDSLESAGHPHQFAALWCQFIDRFGVVKPALAQPFVAAVDRAADLNQLNTAFPLDVLAATAPVEIFYEHYEVRRVAPSR